MCTASPDVCFPLLRFYFGEKKHMYGSLELEFRITLETQYLQSLTKKIGTRHINITFWCDSLKLAYSPHFFYRSTPRLNGEVFKVKSHLNFLLQNNTTLFWGRGRICPSLLFIVPMKLSTIVWNFNELSYFTKLLNSMF